MMLLLTLMQLYVLFPGKEEVSLHLSVIQGECLQLCMEMSHACCFDKTFTTVCGNESSWLFLKYII